MRASRSATDCSVRAASAPRLLFCADRTSTRSRSSATRTAPASTSEQACTDAASSSAAASARNRAVATSSPSQRAASSRTSDRRVPSASAACVACSRSRTTRDSSASICSGVTASSVGWAGEGCSREPHTGHGSPSTRESPSSPAMPSMRPRRSPASDVSALATVDSASVASASARGTRGLRPRGPPLPRAGPGRARPRARPARSAATRRASVSASSCTDVAGNAPARSTRMPPTGVCRRAARAAAPAPRRGRAAPPRGRWRREGSDDLTRLGRGLAQGGRVAVAQLGLDPRPGRLEAISARLSVGSDWAACAPPRPRDGPVGREPPPRRGRRTPRPVAEVLLPLLECRSRCRRCMRSRAR